MGDNAQNGKFSSLHWTLALFSAFCRKSQLRAIDTL